MGPQADDFVGAEYRYRMPWGFLASIVTVLSAVGVGAVPAIKTFVASDELGKTMMIAAGGFAVLAAFWLVGCILL